MSWPLQLIQPTHALCDCLHRWKGVQHTAYQLQTCQHTARQRTKLALSRHAWRVTSHRCRQAAIGAGSQGTPACPEHPTPQLHTPLLQDARAGRTHPTKQAPPLGRPPPSKSNNHKPAVRCTGHEPAVTRANTPSSSGQAATGRLNVHMPSLNQAPAPRGASRP